MKRNGIVLLVVLWLVGALPAWAGNPHCQKVGGVLMTNIGAIDKTYNLGPVFGDLAGSVAAKQRLDLQGIAFQHYWVTASGDQIYFDPAFLTPSTVTPSEPPNSGPDPNVVAVRWGDYKSKIIGGTGKFKNATGYLDYFGLADFGAATLVLRYRGEVCYAGGGDEE